MGKAAVGVAGNFGKVGHSLPQLALVEVVELLAQMRVLTQRVGLPGQVHTHKQHQVVLLLVDAVEYPLRTVAERMLVPDFNHQQVRIEENDAVGAGLGPGLGRQLAAGYFLQVAGRIIRAKIGQVFAGKLGGESRAVVRRQPGSQRRFARGFRAGKGNAQQLGWVQKRVGGESRSTQQAARNALLGGNNAGNLGGYTAAKVAH